MIFVVKKSHLHQFNVETVFLDPNVNGEIHVEQFPYFELINYPRSEWVCLLNKGLYDLNQSLYL